MDESQQLAVPRLGDRTRMGGTAEVAAAAVGLRGLEQELDFDCLERKLDLPRCRSVQYACEQKGRHVGVHGLDISPDSARGLPN